MHMHLHRRASGFIIKFNTSCSLRNGRGANNRVSPDQRAMCPHFIFTLLFISCMQQWITVATENSAEHKRSFKTGIKNMTKEFKQTIDAIINMGYHGVSWNAVV